MPARPAGPGELLGWASGAASWATLGHERSEGSRTGHALGDRE